MAHIQYIDGLVREYLLFRGCVQTLSSFKTELKSDQSKGYRVDKIIEQIVHFINFHDLDSLRDIWSYLNGNLFNKLEYSFSVGVKKLENGILKLYLVKAFTANKNDKITEFFNKLANELRYQSEWIEWFYFPFCKNPSDHPVFAVCFTKQWQDTLLISLHNFLATIFQCMPQPTIAKAENEAILIKKLQEENALLRNRLQQQHHQQQQQQQQQQQLLNNSVVIGGISPGGNSSAMPTGSATSSHQSRLSTFYDQKYYDSRYQRLQQSRLTNSNPQNINEIVAFDVPPPTHVVDDFYIIAQETLNTSNMIDSQARGLRSLIRNISSGGGSPVLGRKESNERNKKRSGSVGSRSWTLHN